jgi:senataxin
VGKNTREDLHADPNQLPPTQISQELEKFQFNESLFVRMAKRDKTNMHLLR